LQSITDRPHLLLAALYLVAALHGLGDGDIVGDDEAREAGIVQAIVAGDWLLPRFNGELLPDKPLLYHWLAAVPCALAGFSEVAVRLPSALAGAALVAWIARFGAELAGARAGLVAAGMLATTPALFHHARVARPDVLLVLLLTMALAFAFRWWRDRSRHAASIALAALGAATLAKGPVAPALFACTLGLFLAWQGDLRRLPRLLTLPGTIALVVLGLGWYVVALAGWGELFVHEHLVGRYARNLLGGLPGGSAYSTRPLAHHLLFYPKHLPAVALPWTPLVLVGLWWAARTGGSTDPRLRFLVCWAVAPVVVFTAAEWKLRYYLLPSLPALALLAAPAALALWERPMGRRERRLVILVGLPLAALAIGALWAAATGRLPLSTSDRSTLDALRPLVPGGTARMVTAVAAVAAAALAVALVGWRPLLTTVAAATAAWLVVGTPAVERAVSRRDSLRAFAEAAARRFPPPQAIVFYRTPIRPVVVYVGHPVPTLAGVEAVPAGTGVIARAAPYRVLARAGLVGEPLATGEGRVGNLARGPVVLAERVAPPYAAAPPPDGSGIGVSCPVSTPCPRASFPSTTATRRATMSSSSSTAWRLISSRFSRCAGVRSLVRSERSISL
jgi:4-amino-4-deoxy-L-arabinose transferase-like glycosyltransferase